MNRTAYSLVGICSRSVQEMPRGMFLKGGDRQSCKLQVMGGEKAGVHHLVDAGTDGELGHVIAGVCNPPSLGYLYLSRHMGAGIGHHIGFGQKCFRFIVTPESRARPYPQPLTGHIAHLREELISSTRAE